MTTYAERVAEAVNDEEWQKFRLSMKGKSTQKKLDMLKAYLDNGRHIVDPNAEYCLVCIRVDNYIKALCRGGQLHPGESITTFINYEGQLRVRR